MSKKSRLLEKAVEAFGELPADVAALGKPLSVHPPSDPFQFGARYAARLRAWLADPVQERIRAAVLTIGLPVLGSGFGILYLAGVRFVDASPEAWLFFPPFGLLLGLLCGGYWWYLSRTATNSTPAAPQPDAGASMPGFIFYRDALVEVRDGEFTVIRWEDVQTLGSPAAARYWCITARDGRQIELSYWVEDEATTLETTVERVTAVLLPQFLQRIDDGKKVMFGQFGVSKRFVYYKEKKVSWDEVTYMRILTGRVYCLQIYCGWLLPWCNFDVLTAPNGQLVYELLRRVAPTRLLKPA